MRPYKCTICNKTIMGLGYMMVHIDKHIADDKYNKSNKITNDAKDDKTKSKINTNLKCI